jgi:LL-diaminopimelate aminotransferase
MFKVNENYRKLPGSYLVSEIGRRVRAREAARPGERVVRLGIGDVTLPLPGAVVSAMQRAAAEMGTPEGFRGYPPEYGYAFLREAIAREDYAALGVRVEPDEVFVSDGAKSDTGNVVDILGDGNRVAVCDPVYPVYVDTNAMAGRAGDLGADGRWTGLTYMPCTPGNGFVPDIPRGAGEPDVAYLCFPNNPTGGAATREALAAWVAFALSRGALILYDSAYEAFVSEPGVPRSIFEIEGARGCAIEFRSLSKTAGFTGTRCSYAVVPKELRSASGASLHELWARRQGTKFNGVAYVVQRAAEAAYSPEGKRAAREAVAYYMANAKAILEGLRAAGLSCWGGVNAPYIWLRAPGGLSSWDFFDLLLDRAGVVGTPGSGFGPSGEGYFRLTAFSSREDTLEAVRRIQAMGL